jgi:hypothetical protein
VIDLRYGRLLDAITLDGDEETVTVLASNKLSISGIDRKTDGEQKFLGSDGDGVDVHGVGMRSGITFNNIWDNVYPQTIEGVAGEGDVVNEPPVADLAALANEIRSFGGAVTYNGNTSIDKKNPMGSQSNPQVAVVNGSFTMKDQSRGYGILLVDGDLRIEAGSRFEGLILLVGKNPDIWIGGNVEIYGSLAVHYPQGSKATIRVGGDSRFQYSSEALMRLGQFSPTLHEDNNTEFTVTRLSEGASRTNGLTSVLRAH